MRRSQRTRRFAIPDDYIVYLQDYEFDVSNSSEPVTFQEVMNSPQSEPWMDAMRDELSSMSQNEVWELVELPKGCKPIECKWVNKIRRDSNIQVERYKARLVTKGHSQREGIDFKETFAPVSTKDSLRIIMAIVAHFDLEFNQMDVRTAFLNEYLYEDVYMTQPVGFVMTGKEHKVCKLKKSIYGLKQA